MDCYQRRRKEGLREQFDTDDRKRRKKDSNSTGGERKRARYALRRVG